MAELNAELGSPEPSDAAAIATDSLGAVGAFAGMLSESEEELVRNVSEQLEQLARLASCGAAAEPIAVPQSTIAGALGGAEMLMRGEILAGRADRLPVLLPGFAYLVTVPFVGIEEALRVSRRAKELLDGRQ